MTVAGSIGSVQLSVGMRVEYQDASWQVTYLDGMQVRIVHISGKTETLPFHHFVSLPSVQRLSEQRAKERPASLSHQLDALFDSLDPTLKTSALDRLADIHEAITGYRSGSSVKSEPHEPRPEYDPASTTETQRLEAKSLELQAAGKKMSARTLRFQRDQYQERGLLALVDARQLRAKLPLGKHREEVVVAVNSVLNDATDASTVTKKKHVADVQRLLKPDLKAGKPRVQTGVPSYSSISRLIDQLNRNKYTYSSAKLRRSIAGRPQRMYQMLTPTRVGEYVVIDASTYDVWGFDSLTGKKVRHRLVVAIDVFSRCVLSARFFENDPKGIDVTFMLHDIIVPKLAPLDWPEDARLPFIGIPEALILRLHDLPEDGQLKAIPFARPDNLMIDNGKIFVSNVFESACERLGISLIVARPYTGNDKAHVERFFETARDGFCVHLPGYTGNNPMNKGANPEEDAYFFRDEMEREFHLWLSQIYHLRPHAGLNAHDVPATSARATPLEAFMAGVSASGHLHIPTDADLYQQLLETEWRHIHSYGVEFCGIYYDAPELLELRNTVCPYSLKKGGQWPFKIDRRDLRYLHFKHPTTGQWIRLKRRDAKAADLPFSGVHLERARESVIADGRSPRSRKLVAEALESLLNDQYYQVSQNRAQRQKEIKGLHQLEQALEDQARAGQREPAYQPMALAQEQRTPDVQEPRLRPGEGFGNVDDLPVDAAQAFSRGTPSFWDTEDEET